MLDIKSKLVLKILLQQCPNGAYNIVESKDIISAMPSKYRVDYDGLDNILIYLERQEYISIKYDDDGVYCLCVLPFGNEALETESQHKTLNASQVKWWQIFLLTFFASFLSSLLTFLLSILI